MNKVYLLEHAVDGLPERMKIIGIFKSKEDAENAVKTLSEKEGFEKTQNDFHIDEYEIGKINWSEGFVL